MKKIHRKHMMWCYQPGPKFLGNMAIKTFKKILVKKLIKCFFLNQSFDTIWVGPSVCQIVLIVILGMLELLYRFQTW